MKTQAYFGLSYGLSGCYMPDSHAGAFAVSRRKDLVAIVRDALESYDLPKSAIHQVKWTRVWAHAKRHGLSSLHFSISHNGNALNFSGMTESEYQEAAESDCL